MISDTLFQAIADIEEYQERYAEPYAAYRVRIDEVKRQMKDLQRRLDCPWLYENDGCDPE